MLNALKKHSKSYKEAEEEKLIELRAKTAARMERLADMPEELPREGKPFDKIDNREKARIDADYPALAICEQDHDIPANIVDISEKGIRLRFAQAPELPETVVIDSPAFSNFLVAELVWQRGAEVGLSIDRAWTEKLAEPFNDLEDGFEALEQHSTAQPLNEDDLS